MFLFIFPVLNSHLKNNTKSSCTISDHLRSGTYKTTNAPTLMQAEYNRN